MDNDSQDPLDGTLGSSKFHTVQAHRDLESNWAVDVAKNLEDYLLKICCGEITAGEDSNFSINFAEAALLLQGSIQVYSRKVEYLYNLVLHTLEFISQSRSQDHVDSTSVQPEASSSREAHDEDDQFWVSNDIPVEAKNCLDNVTSRDALFNNFIKPPANLVVLEGDCLDSTGDGGELESYLLATNTLYRNFILLDPCDSLAVDEFLKSDKSGEGLYGGHRGSSLISKADKSFLSPGKYSGGTGRKSSVKKSQDNIFRASPANVVDENLNNGFEPCPNFDFPDHGYYGFESDEHFDDSDGDDDDPWKPLNPHEPGNLKVKPFRKVKVPRRSGMTKHNNIASQFPLARLHGVISLELTEIWEARLRTRGKQEESQPPFFEMLRQSLVDGGCASHDTFFLPEDDDAENVFDDGINDRDLPDFNMPEATYMDEEINFKHDDFAVHCGIDKPELNEDPNPQASLEDLCRAHLDSLLASIAENEKQTELAARVSTWKQRIEHDLEEEDSRPPFDIHEYGGAVLEKLSHDEGEHVLSFTDVVKGQEKRDVARTFSALLQLVNDRKVDLERSVSAGDSFCYTAVNPFNIRLMRNGRIPKKQQIQPTKKRAKSPIKRVSKSNKGDIDSESRPLVVSLQASESKLTAPILSQPNCKFSTKLGKAGGLRCTPDGKRRRRSRLVEPFDLNSSAR